MLKRFCGFISNLSDSVVTNLSAVVVVVDCVEGIESMEHDDWSIGLKTWSQASGLDGFGALCCGGMHWIEVSPSIRIKDKLEHWLFPTNTRISSLLNASCSTKFTTYIANSL